jgi:multidrug resistance protein, MATE family
MKALTKHPPGSMRELLSISFPMMLTALSASLFVFVDRILLSYYSTEAMNAVSGVGIVFFALYYPGCAIAAITEVFVGQYNGAEQYNKIAAPVWQMIWFSLASIIIYVPAALLGETLFLSPVFVEEGLAYYQILVIGAPLFLIQSALIGFFIGTGRPKIVTIAMFFSNIVNFILNYFFIFGIGIIPPMGAAGSAAASMIAESILVIILLWVFLSNHNNAVYKTRLVTWDLSLMWKQLKVGVPGAIGHTFEIAGWAFLSNFRAGYGAAYVVVIAISSSTFGLISFYTEGLHKGVTAIVSNMIGARNFKGLEKAKRSAYLLHILSVGVLFIPLVVCSDIVVRPLIDINTLSESTLFAIKMGLLGNFIFMLFDGFFWIYNGVLLAGGDTKMVMIISSFSVWIFCVLPAAGWLTYFPSESYTVSLYFFPIYGALVAVILYLRVRSNKWIKLDLSKD